MQPQGPNTHPPSTRAVKSVPPRRRARIPLSCDPCRTRKLKCNREYPCQNCTARDEQTSCHFKGPKNGPPSNVRRESHGDTMRQRIDNLEGLVKRLIARNSQSPPKPVALTPDCLNCGELVASETQDVALAGKTVMNGTQSIYQAGDDWYDVLQEINELRNTWNLTQDDPLDHSVRPTQSQQADGTSLLFSQVKPIERMEILATLPPRRDIDELVAGFFNRQNFPIAVPPIIHEPTFIREYEEHWRDPSQTNLIWLGLLFSILGITMLAYHQYGEPPEYEGLSESLFQFYRMRTAQCLLSGDIAKCLPYTVETLRLNATAELNRKDDNRRGLWIMTGVLVRTAINMGYHRDPSHSSSISLMQAEYRRRTWLSVTSMDDMTSFGTGLPRAMSGIYTDTMEPRNLHDWELSDDAVNIPPSRPLTEPTPVTYLIVKGRLCRAIGRVADLNSNPTPTSYESVLEIDNLLYVAYDDFPPHMKPTHHLEQSQTSSPRALYANLNLWSMYHRAMCTLHRKFMARAKTNRHFKFSRDRCISSALALLSSQQDLARQWYQFSHTRQTLTFAAMVLFLELELIRKFPESEDAFEHAALIQALETSVAFWEADKEVCDEAWRQWQVLASMLAGLQPFAGVGGATEAVSTDASFDLAGLNSPFQMPLNTFTFEKEMSAVEVDWATWDSYVEDAGAGPGPVY
ncbi:Zn(II)2Cys6 transcription factor [Aspergillus homomorphus CBS 101889]|uniref:Zn(2)-C6 fungal-type domain-containing protein n=1 Tax=Aspergillus homomorphus (strain CBS 101889) TaxID=1450537 RepID=A0A395I7W9_ASPHC|nr:hypothetical protein BO97DRAFT_384265 [Aspergillus homomorphus CBS 101889]RAL16191.1 hypothetical protein BO97DRAFT_384265 [Aspergillus homomorphus CBS 101889]